jgi:hypothetical protein
VESSLDGVLGGFADLDKDDVIESKKFIQTLGLQNFDIALGFQIFCNFQRLWSRNWKSY